MEDLSAIVQAPLSRSVHAMRARGDEALPVARTIAEEVPVAFRYGGIAHAVMMATPDHLADFAIGFSLTEGIIARAGEIVRIEARAHEDGLRLEIALDGEAMRRFLRERRVRQLRGHTGCGICGAEDLADIRRPARRVAAAGRVDATVIAQAVDELRRFQTLSRETHGAHAAAWVSPDARIEAVREDVGRHNALDKLIGAGLRDAFSSRQGFCLVTSRCSFEMVQKAVMADYSTLVSMSAPTALAVRTAAAAGLVLYAGAAQDRYTAPPIHEGEPCR